MTENENYFFKLLKLKLCVEFANAKERYDDLELEYRRQKAEFNLMRPALTESMYHPHYTALLFDREMLLENRIMRILISLGADRNSTFKLDNQGNRYLSIDGYCVDKELYESSYFDLPLCDWPILLDKEETL